MRKQPSRALAAQVSAALSLLFLGSCVLVFDYGDYTDPTGDQAASSGSGSASGSSSGTGGGPVSCDAGATVDCYTGPEGSEGVGLCRMGTATCDADGMGISECMGEIKPALEMPANSLDEDCDGQSAATPIWARRFGGLSEQNLHRTVLGGDSLFLAGWFQERIDLGNDKSATRAMASGPGWYAAKVNAEGGGATWLTPSPTTDRPSYAQGITPPVLNYVYVAGYLGGGGASGEDGFVTQLNPTTGAPGWTQTISGTGASNDRAVAVAAKDMGSVYVAANFESAVTIVPMETVSTKGKHDILIASYSFMTSTPQWARGFGGPEEDVALDMASAPTGSRLTVTGAYRDALYNGADPVTPPAGTSSDIFVLSLDLTGKFLWARGFVDSQNIGDGEGRAVTVTDSGNVVVVGRMSGTVDCSNDGSTLLSTAGGYDAFVANLNGVDGSLLWCKRFGAPLDQEATGVSADTAGNIYVVGTFDGMIDFDDNNSPTDDLKGAPGQNIFGVKLNSSGDVVWTVRFGEGEPLEPRSIRASATPDGALLLAGAWTTALSFGTPGGPLTSEMGDGFDVFAVRFSE